MRSNFFKGFIVFLVLSFFFNLLFMFTFNKEIENFASDLLHLIPAVMFNALLEVIFPIIPDILFLMPLVLTDAIIGGFVGFLLGCYFKNKSKGTFYTFMVISFAIFEFVDVNLIPIFSS